MLYLYLNLYSPVKSRRNLNIEIPENTEHIKMIDTVNHINHSVSYILKNWINSGPEHIQSQNWNLCDAN